MIRFRVLLVVFEIIVFLEHVRYYLFPQVAHPWAVVAESLPDTFTDLIDVICPTVGIWLGVEQSSSYTRLFEGLISSKMDAILFAILMVWIKLQFTVLEVMAETNLLRRTNILSAPYEIASKFVRDTARLGTEYCRHTKGPSPERGRECYFCWEEITTDQNSIEHRQCHNYFHEHCLVRWASFSEDALAVCGVCRGPLTTGAEVVQFSLNEFRYEYRLSIIGLVAKRSALLATFFTLACALWWTTLDPFGHGREVSARIYDLLVYHAIVWCVRMAVTCSEYTLGEYKRLCGLSIPDKQVVVDRAERAFLGVSAFKWIMLFWMLIQMPGLPTQHSQPAGLTAFIGLCEAYTLLSDLRAIEFEHTADQRGPPRWLGDAFAFVEKWARRLIVWQL